MRMAVPTGRLSAALLVGATVLALWVWLHTAAIDLEALTVWFAARRDAWYMLPLVMIGFVVLGLVLVPVMLLIATTGIAFGPLLGPLYAMAGCLASASAGFVIGRFIGLERVRRFGGQRVTRVTRVLKRNGTLAVFLVRKVPVPFALANIVVGASTVAYRDFVIGTVLGMGAFVVGLAGFGYQLTEALQDPTPDTLAVAAVFVIVPLTLALLINHTFRRMRTAE